MSDQDIRQDAALTENLPPQGRLIRALAKFLNSEITPSWRWWGGFARFCSHRLHHGRRTNRRHLCNVFIAFPGASARKLKA